MKANDKLMKLAEELVKYGKSKGASEAQVSISSGNSFSVDIRDGKVEQLIDAGSTGLSLKVLVDNKSASASSSDMRIETLHKLVDNAIARAKYGSADEFAKLPEKQEIKVSHESLELYDEKVLALTPEYKIQQAKLLEELCMRDKRINKSGGASFSTYNGESVLANSNGFLGGYPTTSCSIGVGLQTGTGDNMYEDGWWSSNRKVSGLENINEIAEKAIFRTARMIGARKIESQKVPVVFDPSMTGSIILGFLTSCLSGGAIYMNRSFLAGKLGTKIANELINIVDDPLIPGAPGTEPFDDEGVPTYRNEIVTNGILKSYILSTYSARKLNMKSTGNAGGVHNFHLASGKYSREEIIKSVDKGLYLCSTIGQGTVPTSGDISKGAYGIWIENGKLTYPVSEITITGNLGTILNDIEMIGNDPLKNRSISGPTVKVRELSISGK